MLILSAQCYCSQGIPHVPSCPGCVDDNIEVKRTCAALYNLEACYAVLLRAVLVISVTAFLGIN